MSQPEPVDGIGFALPEIEAFAAGEIGEHGKTVWTIVCERCEPQWEGIGRSDIKDSMRDGAAHAQQVHGNTFPVMTHYFGQRGSDQDESVRQ